MRQRPAPPNESYFAENPWVLGGGVAPDPEAAAAFADLVHPLELAAGKLLGEPARSRCLAAYRAHPDGFTRCVLDAKRRGRRNPIGLLVPMVVAGEHRLSVPPPRDPFACSSCDRSFTSTYDRREHEGGCHGA
jgi:hypothetical protein